MREGLKKLSPKFLIECYKGLRYFTITMLFYIFRLIPIKKNRIVFMNVWGFGDNGKYVLEELVSRKKPYEIIFICNQPEHQEAPKSVILLKTNTIAAIKALATAKVWVESNQKEAYVRKRKKQFYIQLWHGGLALKKIEGDCAEYLGDKYIKRAKKDSRMTDLYISNSRFCTDMYRRAFFYEGAIKELGTPRMDLLLSVDEDKKHSTKAELHIPEDKKIALYAPTYRDTDDVSVYQMDYESLRQGFMRKFGGEWCIVIRLHPLVHNQSHELKLSENVIDASSYRDMYELMQASDVLITDYSNTMFEFAMTQKPVFLYAKDLITYQDERGFNFNYMSLPFAIATQEDQLEADIAAYDENVENSRVSGFFDSIGMKEDGMASKRVVDEIEKVM
ncbi:MAG: CDP-glycerol glycerophosphotransferase family protein [Clostridiales bacterium]|nr:CDP-glycerol glycerophosphotransferase family protein [Clostridiales bacterium]